MILNKKSTFNLMKLKADKFNSLLLRQKNMKIELSDMKAHQNIIGDNLFKKDIKKEEDKKKVKNIEDIFDKGTNNKHGTPCGKPKNKCKCKSKKNKNKK
jgi:hypothetical protein